MDIEGSVKDPLLNDSKIGGRDKNGDNEDDKDEYDKEEESGKENSRKDRGEGNKVRKCQFWLVGNDR